ncbi:MAG TPA: M1 family metallopeptidase, partial [Ignavibacteriaceae bacterium]
SQQKLFIPRNIQAAYEKGTRSLDGRPGAEYWQNHSEYKIEVEVDPTTYKITGSEEITFYNNSPDSLNRIVLRLYPNVFKKGSARDYSFNPESANEGMNLTKLIVGDKDIDLENLSFYRVTNTIATIYFREKIPPKSFTKLSIEWSFNLPTNVTWRMGVYDSTTVLVGYWYPQIAVYDDINGWDDYNHGGQEEFYNDFSNFEVKITLPNNFGVWATGELQNPENVLVKQILQKYLKANESDTVINIITEDDLKSSQIFNNDETKNSWVFKSDGVTDFAFALSDHYLWDGMQTIVDSTNSKSVFIQAVYPMQSPDFYHVVEISKEIIKYYSNLMPGVKFPFSSFTAFNNGQSGGGMEFPMIINDGSPSKLDETIALAAHELTHQYFPFYVGTNEKKYAFMDEGLAVMLPYKYIEKVVGFNSRLLYTVATYETLAGTDVDIPPMIPSLFLSYASYRNSAYNRPSLAYNILKDMIGDQLFHQSMQEFIQRWKGKHPTPYDFFFTFNDVTGQDLNWFWKPWFFESGYPDLA